MPRRFHWCPSGPKEKWVKLSNRFFWEDAYKETVNYVESCQFCAKIKNSSANRDNLNPILDFDKPFDTIGIDILKLSMTSNGNKYCLVFTDYLTKWVEAFLMRNVMAETVANILLNEILTRHSAPTRLVSDQGANFMNFRSRLVKGICESIKSKRHFF